MTAPDYSTTRCLTDEKPTCFDGPVDDMPALLKTPDSERKISEGGLRLQEQFKTSSDEKPLITVVTVVYNGAEFLEDTIKSVIEQGYNNVEYIIVDGGSTDSTLDIIRKYEHAIDYWVSEPDGGIYDAMNKGLKLASGSIIGMLNADDFLEKDATERIVKSFDGGVDYVYSEVKILDLKGNITSVKQVEEPLEMALPYRMPFGHQSLYVHRTTINDVGLYDTRYRLSADLDFVCRIVESKKTGLRVPGVLASFRAGGASGGLKTFLETRRIAVQYGMQPLVSWLRLGESLMKMSVHRALPLPVSKWLRQLIGSSYKVPDDRNIG